MQRSLGLLAALSLWVSPPISGQREEHRMAQMTPQGEQNLIKDWEGCRLVAYWDNIGMVWTWGWGETGPIDGVMPHAGATITQAQADSALSARLAATATQIENFLSRPATPY